MTGMIDKVLRGLECCATGPENKDVCWGLNCPYQSEKHCMTALHRDALVVLKAQQPRVLTLEEVLGGDECWIEGRSGARGYGDALLTNDAERVEFYRTHTISMLDFYAYGRAWRCWDRRPTDGQREAVEWDAD